MKPFDDCALLITGCMKPSTGIPVLSLSDPLERKKQYIESIIWYIDNSNFKNIIYCDNSCPKEETNIALYAKEKGKCFEWLSFTGDFSNTIKHGKGYGEGEIIRYALFHSKLLSRAKCFVKVTGRLIVKNINSICKRFVFSDHCFYYFTESSRLFKKKPAIETRFYCIGVKLYKQYFVNSYQKVNDDNQLFLEKIFQKVTVDNNIQGQKIFPFPHIIGQSGSIGVYYYCPLYRRIIKSVLSLANYYIYVW